MERQVSNEQISSDDFLKVRAFISCNKIQASSLLVQTFIQEANEPQRSVNVSQQVQVNNKKADFPSPIPLEYVFEIRQRLIFRVFDASSSDRKLIGQSQATIGQLFKAQQKGITRQIQNQGKGCGELSVKCEKVDKIPNRSVAFDVITQKLDVGKSFMCFGIGQSHWKLFSVRNNVEAIIYESELRKGDNCRYSKFQTTQTKFCNNDPKQPVIMRFFKCTSDDLIGQCRFDLASLKEGKNQYQLTKNGEEKGIIVIQNFKNVVFYNFTEYLSAGLQVAMVVGIDFTAKNGNQSDSKSLHYFSEATKSKYEEALHDASAIVLDYDTDKRVPCYGFGAKVKMPNYNSNDSVSHCFPLNGSQNNPDLVQLNGIKEAYRKCLPHLEFSGPTLLCPILKQAMTECQRMKKQRKSYMVLLILTDGVVDDKQDVKDLLVKCGKLPLSVIIVGIGDGDWSAMQQLDDNEMQMTDKQGNRTERDLVQFVEFQKYKNGVELASEILYQLPRQVAEYHELNDLTPQIYKKK